MEAAGGGGLPEPSAQRPPAPSPARRYSEGELPGTVGGGSSRYDLRAFSPTPSATGKPQIGIAEGRTGQAGGGEVILVQAWTLLWAFPARRGGVAAAVEAAAAKEEASKGGVADWLLARLGPRTSEQRLAGG